MGLDSANITAPGEAAGQGIPKGVPCPAVFAFGQIGGEFILNANMASAHSSVESQAFYRKMGCVEAMVYNRQHVEAEPYDCQLECVL